MTHATSDSNQADDLLAWNVDGFSSCDLPFSSQTQPARNFVGHLKKGALLEMLSLMMLMSKRLAKSFQLLISHPGIVRKRIIVIRYCQILDTFLISELSFKLVCHACLNTFLSGSSRGSDREIGTKLSRWVSRSCLSVVVAWWLVLGHSDQQIWSSETNGSRDGTIWRLPPRFYRPKLQQPGVQPTNI